MNRCTMYNCFKHKCNWYQLRVYIWTRCYKYITVNSFVLFDTLYLQQNERRCVIHNRFSIIDQNNINFFTEHLHAFCRRCDLSEITSVIYFLQSKYSSIVPIPLWNFITNRIYVRSTNRYIFTPLTHKQVSAYEPCQPNGRRSKFISDKNSIDEVIT